MPEPRPNDPDATRTPRARRNVPMMLLILGLVVFGLVLFQVKGTDIVELQFYELD